MLSGSVCSCCADAPTCVKAYPSILPRVNQRRVSVRASSLNGVAELPAPIHSTVEVDDSARVRTACDIIKQSAAGVCGLDMEWNVSFSKGSPTQPIATIQLAVENQTLVFHLCNSKGMYSMPPCLKDLLEDATIKYVGAGIQGDVLKLETDYGVRVPMYEDIGTLFKAVPGRSHPRPAYTLQVRVTVR
jgi:hypothetical protein